MLGQYTQLVKNLPDFNTMNIEVIPCFYIYEVCDLFQLIFKSFPGISAMLDP